MNASFSFITTVLIMSALVVSNVVVSNDRLEHPMEVVILFGSVVREGDRRPLNTIFFFYNTIVEFQANFFLDECNVRLAVVRFNYEDSKVLQNLTPSLQPLDIPPLGRFQGDPIMLHESLVDAETKIFTSSRQEAMKIIFVILPSMYGLDVGKCETAARKLQEQEVTIFVAIFTSDHKKNFSVLHNIAGGGSNVNKVLWPTKNTSVLAGEVMVWLKGRIVELIQLRRSSSSTSRLSTVRKTSKISGFTFSKSDQPAPSPTDGMATWLIAVIFCSSFLVTLIMIVIIAAIVQKKRWKKVNKAFPETTATAATSKERRQAVKKLASERRRPQDKEPRSVSRRKQSVKAKSKSMSMFKSII